MDTNYPHDIVELDEMRAELQKHFVPLTAAEHERMRHATPEERSEFLKHKIRRKIDQHRTAAIAHRVMDKLQKVVDPIIDKMSEDAEDHENAPLVLGMLIGVRAWWGQFRAVELETMKAMDSIGISKARYDALCAHALAEGFQILEDVKKLLADEEELQGDDKTAETCRAKFDEGTL